MTTGQLIKSARKSAGMTQSELAQKLNIPFQSVSQWERDLRNPKKETLERIAVALGVSYFDLMSKQDRAMYEASFKEGMEAEEWQNYVIDELNRREGYTYSDVETRLINAFSQLNDDGQGKVIALAEDLTEIPRYQATAAPESPPPTREGNDTTPEEKPSTGL